MRIFISVLLLIFVFQSFTKADDIRDFEIEGMSIGDSALDYFSEAKILSNKKNWYRDNKFYGVLIDIKSDNFNSIQLHFKTNDTKYKIYALGGLKDFIDNPKDCYPLKKEVDIGLQNIFKNSKINHTKKRKHPADKTGKSFVTQSFFDLDNGAVVTACYDMGENYDSDFRIIVNTEEIDKWYGIAYD
tara:strand:- start:257 stop:817 length:561 start_codon:yes stop_codon:yes gene_type:complete